MAANDSQQTWKTLQNLLAKNPSERTQVPKNLFVDELIIVDLNIILNNFNDFFTNIGTKLAQTHEETDFNTISKLLSKRFGSSMYVNPSSSTKIFNVINALGSKRAAGCDDIPSKFIKFSSDVIAQYLHYYFNLVLNFGIFLESCKIAKVAPIHKSGSKLEMGNYRLLSILTCFSKILEKNFISVCQHFWKNTNYYNRLNMDFKKIRPLLTLCLMKLATHTTN